MSHGRPFHSRVEQSCTLSFSKSSGINYELLSSSKISFFFIKLLALVVK